MDDRKRNDHECRSARIWLSGDRDLSWARTKKLDKEVILKAVIIPMVVMSAVFLVVAGYDDQQIAPAMGLLGTVVGYVLGTSLNRHLDSPA